MVKVKKIRRSIPEQKEAERLRNEVARLRAENDYIAMMCNIDLHQEEAGGKDEKEN